MTHWNVDDIDSNAIADEFSTSQQKVAGRVYAARHTPRAFNDLVASGADPGQIPPWFMRPDGEDAVTTSPETPPSTLLTPPATPETEVNLVKTQELPTHGEEGYRALEEGGRALEVPPTSPDLDDPTRGGGNRLGAVYDGVRLQSERLSKLGIIRDQGGRYLKASTNPDGTPGFVEVDPVEVERDIIKDVGTKISEAAVGQLNIHMRTVMRKVG